MKRSFICLLLALLLLSAVAFAESDPARDYSGVWADGDYTLEFAYNDEDEMLTGCLTGTDESGDCLVWEFYACFYYAEGDFLWCPGISFHRDRIDPETFERVEVDWWMTDLGDACFAFGDDGDTLVGRDIQGIDAPLTLHRAEDSPSTQSPASIP